MVAALVIIFIWLLVLLNMFLYKSWLAMGITFLVPVCLVWFMWKHPGQAYSANQIGMNGIANVKDNKINTDDVNSEYSTIAYAEEDDTYDGFHMQREEEYKEEYGDDHEDAIQDEWEEHQRENKYRKS